MNILAFESSCDETSASVVSRDGERFTIKSNIIASQVDTHKLYGGVVPEIASRAHIEAISSITYEALERAGLGLGDIDLVAVTANPGLIGALLVGVNFAKSLAFSHNIPLVAVDHIKGHICSACLLDDAPKPPFIALAVSGGHTAIYKVTSFTSIKQIGTTRDDAMGESFDKIGRIIGISYPAGRGFDELSREGFLSVCGDTHDYFGAFKRSEAYRKGDMSLPSPAIHGDTLDFSFSGLKTAAINLIHRYEQRGEELPRALFAARYTYEAVEAVASKLESALSGNQEMNLVICGGVSANSHLRARLTLLCEKMGRKIYIPDSSLAGDNAAMIAVAGYYEYERNNFADTRLNASALDSVD